MELRTLDPKILQPNPANPRQTMAGDHADNQLIANIRALGILQPPVVRQENGDFIIIAGHRRVRAALALDLPEILVLLRDSDDGADSVRAVSENVVRCPLSPVDQWRASRLLAPIIGTTTLLAPPSPSLSAPSKSFGFLPISTPPCSITLQAATCRKRSNCAPLPRQVLRSKPPSGKHINPRGGNPPLPGGKSPAPSKNATSTLRRQNSVPTSSRRSVSFGKRTSLLPPTKTQDIPRISKASSPPKPLGWTPICQRMASSFQPTTMAIRNFRRKRNASGVRKRKGTRSAAALIREAARSGGSSSAFRSRLRSTESKRPLNPTMTLPSPQPKTGPHYPKSMAIIGDFAPMRSPKPLAKPPSTTSP